MVLRVFTALVATATTVTGQEQESPPYVLGISLDRPVEASSNYDQTPGNLPGYPGSECFFTQADSRRRCSNYIPVGFGIKKVRPPGLAWPPCGQQNPYPDQSNVDGSIAVNVDDGTDHLEITLPNCSWTGVDLGDCCAPGISQCLTHGCVVLTLAGLGLASPLDGDLWKCTNVSRLCVSLAPPTAYQLCVS